MPLLDMLVHSCCLLQPLVDQAEDVEADVLIAVQDSHEVLFGELQDARIIAGCKG